MNEKMLKIILNANTRHMYIDLVERKNITKEVALRKLDDLFQYGCHNHYEPSELYEVFEEAKQMVMEFFNSKEVISHESETVDEVIEQNNDLTFIRINQNIALNKDLTMQEKVILGVINTFETNFMSNQYLSKITGLSLSSIEHLIPKLEKANFLQINKQWNNKRVIKRTMKVTVPTTNEIFLNENFTGISIQGEYLKNLKLHQAYIFSIVMLLDNGDGCCLSEAQWKQLTNINRSSVGRTLKQLEENDLITSVKKRGMNTTYYIKDRSLLDFKCMNSYNSNDDGCMNSDDSVSKLTMKCMKTYNGVYENLQRDTNIYTNIYTNNYTNNKEDNFANAQSLKQKMIQHLNIQYKDKYKKQLQTLFDNYSLELIEKYYTCIKLDKSKFTTTDYYFNTYIKKLNERIEHEEMKIKQMKQKEETIKCKLENAYFYFNEQYTLDELDRYYSNYEASSIVPEAMDDIPYPLYSYFCQM